MALPELRDDLMEYKEMMLLYGLALKKLEVQMEIMKEEFRFAHRYNPIERIDSRIKTEEDMVRKLQRQGKEITIDNLKTYVEDIAGIRVICPYTTDVYRIVDMICGQQELEVLRTRDYFLDPKANGFRSYLMIVAIPIQRGNTVVKVKVEIQIQTVVMDYWAKLQQTIDYKYEGNMPEYLYKDLKECAELIQFLDKKMISIDEEGKNYKK